MIAGSVLRESAKVWACRRPCGVNSIDSGVSVTPPALAWLSACRIRVIFVFVITSLCPWLPFLPENILSFYGISALVFAYQASLIAEPAAALGSDIERTLLDLNVNRMEVPYLCWLGATSEQKTGHAVICNIFLCCLCFWPSLF